MNQQKQDVMETGPALSAAMTELMLAHMLRAPAVFKFARQHLDPLLFNRAGEFVYGIIWRCAGVEALISVTPIDGWLRRMLCTFGPVPFGEGSHSHSGPLLK